MYNPNSKLSPECVFVFDTQLHGIAYTHVQNSWIFHFLDCKYSQKVTCPVFYLSMMHHHSPEKWIIFNVSLYQKRETGIVVQWVEPQCTILTYCVRMPLGGLTAFQMQLPCTMEILGYCRPCGRHRWSSRLLVSAWPSPIHGSVL